MSDKVDTSDVLSQLSATTMHLRLPNGQVLVWLTPEGEVYDYANEKHTKMYDLRGHYWMLVNRDGTTDKCVTRVELDPLDCANSKKWGFNVHVH